MTEKEAQVHVVLRGSELNAVYATPELADEAARKLNELFPRGTRYVAYPMFVRTTIGE